MDDFTSEGKWGSTKMNIGSGLYGPATNLTHTGEKHWSLLNERTRTEYKDILRLDEYMEEQVFLCWLTKCKHYSAEYYEKD